jgi:hypothetical protein
LLKKYLPSPQLDKHLTSISWTTHSYRFSPNSHFQAIWHNTNVIELPLHKTVPLAHSVLPDDGIILLKQVSVVSSLFICCSALVGKIKEKTVPPV